MSQNSDDHFERCKQENIDAFDFTRIITAVRATNFGWAQYNQDRADDWFLRRCVELAADVMDGAYNEAQMCGAISVCECGGFYAEATPAGDVWLKFILASWGEDRDMVYVAPPQAQNNTPPETVVVPSRRRIIQLHKEH